MVPFSRPTDICASESDGVLDWLVWFVNRGSMCTWPKRWLRTAAETTWMPGEWQRWSVEHSVTNNGGTNTGSWYLILWFLNSGVWDCNERVGQERSLGTAPEFPSGSPASGNVEEVYPVGKKQPVTYGRPDPHHKKRWLFVPVLMPLEGVGWHFPLIKRCSLCSVSQWCLPTSSACWCWATIPTYGMKQHNTWSSLANYWQRKG